MATDKELAAAHLKEVDNASKAATAAALTSPPPWFWPTVALCGPAIISFRLGVAESGRYSATETNLLTFGGIVLGSLAVVSVALAAYLQRQTSVVKLKAPIRGGQTSIWVFAMTFAITFGLLATGNIGLSGNPLIPAALSYLWLAIVPQFAWTQHVQRMTSS